MSAGAASCATLILGEDSCTSMSWHAYPRLRIGNQRRFFWGGLLKGLKRALTYP